MLRIWITNIFYILTLSKTRVYSQFDLNENPEGKEKLEIAVKSLKSLGVSYANIYAQIEKEMQRVARRNFILYDHWQTIIRNAFY